MEYKRIEIIKKKITKYLLFAFINAQSSKIILLNFIGLSKLVWLQVAKLLILRSPLLEKIKLRIFSFDTRGVVRDIRQEHSWFDELVNFVGVRLCCVDMCLEGTNDSSYGDFSDLEDLVAQGEDDDGSFSDDSEEGDSDQAITDDDDEEWEDADAADEHHPIQCAQNWAVFLVMLKLFSLCHSQLSEL